nr:MAG TPA: hypothetical protein [Caudoviricetes sp.]
MAIFKGEITLSDIMTYPWKFITTLRDIRIEQLKDEQKEMEKMTRDSESSSIRNQILSPL